MGTSGAGGQAGAASRTGGHHAGEAPRTGDHHAGEASRTGAHPTTVAVLGDMMLGRLCGEHAGRGEAAGLFDEAVRAATATADLVVANLECCISDRGARWPDPRKRFFFRAPPAAATVLADLGVDVVTLANNHALDYGTEALLDTIDHCTAAGVRVVGAGPDVAAARAPVIVDAAGTSLAVLGVADHPAGFAATGERPGIALADLHRGVPGWLVGGVEEAARRVDVVLVTPHWGPNMTTSPPPHVAAAADALVAAGARVVAGHSAHVFHGIAWHGDACVLYDAGDLIDDYAVDRRLRNDLGALWTFELDGARPVAVRALPLHLGPCRTERAQRTDADWIAARLERACAPYRTAVQAEGGTLVCRPAR